MGSDVNATYTVNNTINVVLVPPELVPVIKGPSYVAVLESNQTLFTLNAN
jgi:hypothetical protein